jgi:hypothetical protein
LAPQGKPEPPQFRIERGSLVILSDLSRTHDLPILLRQHVTDQIVFVQPVHDQRCSGSLYPYIMFPEFVN